MISALLSFVPGLNIVGAAFKFLKSPLGVGIMAVLAFMAWTTYVRHDAAKGAQSACQEATLRVTTEALQVQIKKVNEALEAAAQQSIQDEDELFKIRNERDAIIKEARKGSGCTIEPHILKRLRELK